MKLIYVGALIGFLFASYCIYCDAQVFVPDENWKVQLYIATTLFAFVGDLIDNHDRNV